jgi:3-isopropylmalate/(R)-2-methylmalate dehydratase small subunit
MQEFTVHTGQAAPLRAGDVDTDQIIPVRFLTRLTKAGHVQDLFADWREDPGFVLNVEPYSAATILVAGPNFGTGSSRQHAVWALRDWGFKAVIAPRFGDIFRGNALKEGLLPVQLELKAVEALWEMADSEPDKEITVDLGAREVRVDDAVWAFPIDDFSRWRLMEGLDDIGLTLRHEQSITSYEKTRPSFKPVTV